MQCSLTAAHHRVQPVQLASGAPDYSLVGRRTSPPAGGARCRVHPGAQPEWAAGGRGALYCRCGAGRRQSNRWGCRACAPAEQAGRRRSSALSPASIATPLPAAAGIETAPFRCPHNLPVPTVLTLPDPPCCRRRPPCSTCYSGAGEGNGGAGEGTGRAGDGAGGAGHSAGGAGERPPAGCRLPYRYVRRAWRSSAASPRTAPAWASGCACFTEPPTCPRLL